MTAAHEGLHPKAGDAGERAPDPWWGVDDIPAGWGPCVATVGVVDGEHTGHHQLLRAVVEHGDRLGIPVVLVTFDPHPARVAGPARDTSTSDPTAAIPAPGGYRVQVSRPIAAPQPLLHAQVPDLGQVLVPAAGPRPGSTWSGRVGLDSIDRT
ncbi:MAG: hypothetical protein JWQ53_933 [Klenkia sp.]|nr:hypothetical protein [Klenkia sp.]